MTWASPPAAWGMWNVQVILEEFGGGGHFTGAGAQIKNVSVADVRRALLRELTTRWKRPQTKIKRCDHF